jgi:small-conductance mechanosensitive channel
MHRLPLLLLMGLLYAAGAARAEGDWAGTWETHWRGSGGHMILEQEGDTVTGRHPLYQGRIEGKARAEAQGSRLEGQWFVGATSGKFIAVLSRDKHTFTGRFDDGEWWTGERTRPYEISPRIGMRSPRETFTRFVVAGNLARSGIDDAWGAAAEAVEFGGASSPMTRIEQLHEVRSLFALVDLTTFRYWSIPEPPPGTDSVVLHLEQLRSNVVLKLMMRRDSEGNWHIVSPGEDEMRAARTALLALYGGKPPASDAFRRLQTPRDTMRAFLEGMADWDGPGRALALSTLDLSEFPQLLRKANGEVAAHFLRRVLDHIGLVGLQSIPNDGATRDPYLHFVHGAGRIVIAPAGAAPDAPWQFTAQTIADIREIYRATETLPPPLATPPGSIPESAFFTLRDQVAKSAPFLLGRVRDLEYWQVLVALIAVSAAVVLARIGASVICRGLRRLLGATDNPHWFFWSLVVLIALAVLSPMPGALGLAEGFREYSLPFWGVVASIAAGVVAWHLLRTFGRFIAALAKHTATPMDDILVTLVLAGAQLSIIVVSALGAAYFLSIPTTNLLAGLGIGGLALAFASRETLSNLFGAGILVTDRPFRRGDWIKTGDVEGSVELVGIRSTRVRTAQDSVVFVPNGKLVDSTINNLGTRRHRLVKLQLLVTAGGTPEKLDAFTAALRRRITDDPAFVANRTDVGVAGISQSGIAVELTTYLDIATDAAESAARHALLLDVVRLAERSGLTLGNGMARPAT